MAANTSNFGELLEPGLQVRYGLQRKAWEKEYTVIFEEKNAPQRTVHSLSMSGFGLFPTKAEGAGISYDDPLQGFKQNSTVVTYGMGFIVTEEMYEDDLYDQINAMPKALAHSEQLTVETVCANVLNRAFNSSYTGADGLELCSTAHLLEGGGTWKNELSSSADLDMTSYEQALIDIGDFVDGRGLLTATKGKKLIIPTELAFQAAKILGSDKDPESANNAINPAKNTMPWSVNHYLTDSDAWFILTDATEGFKLWWKRRPAFGKDNDFASGNALYKTTFRLIPVWDDPRCAFGSPGA